MLRVEVWLKDNLTDYRGQGLLKDITDLPVNGATTVRVADIYWLPQDTTFKNIEFLGQELFSDPVTQQFYIGKRKFQANQDFTVTNRDSVSDPSEENIKKAAKDLGVNLSNIRIGKRYVIEGKLSSRDSQNIVSRLLVNPVLNKVIMEEPSEKNTANVYQFNLVTVPLLQADEKHKAEIKKLGFNDAEFEAITDYFQNTEKRNPTDAELETLAQTWSEHCVHKTFKAEIEYEGQIIDSLFKETIYKATKDLNCDWCLSVFKDNAGVVKFTDDYAVSFKAETHNHPSAIEPYGGAATGIGGCVRDILGTGLSGKPIANTDIFCFGMPDTKYKDLPKGALHPRRIMKGVKSGVADYGNRLGIPTVNGAICFDERFAGNPLVFCGSIGLMPNWAVPMGQQNTGDKVIVIGGHTGRDGIHGVTFSSVELTDKSGEDSISAVQVGNAIVEKKVIDVLMQARDKKLFNRITDCGGGGFSSAIGEMGEETGVKVYLEQAPLKDTSLSYYEIWVSESQERMILSVPPQNVEALLALCASENVEAAVIGEFDNNKRLQLFYQGNKVADLDMGFLHGGLPRRQLKATWSKPVHTDPLLSQKNNYNEDLLTVLSAYNVCSKEWVIRQYDHEVQGGSVIKPFSGCGQGPSDSAVVRPLLDRKEAIVVANGINTKFGDIDPYWMAASCIDEAIRQVVATGGDVKRVALLDNFSWGSTDKQENLGALVRAARACHDMAVFYKTPYISGKDSLNNEFTVDGQNISIPHTLLISALGFIADSDKAVTTDLKKAGNVIYIVGVTKDEMGGSEYYRSKGYIGTAVPQVNAQLNRSIYLALNKAMEKSLIESCHDLSEGGLAVAAAEMCFAGNLGMDMDLENVITDSYIGRDDTVLFSESNGRLLVEVAPHNTEEFEKLMISKPYYPIAIVTEEPYLTINNMHGQEIIKLANAEMKEAWQRTLRW
ncbi:MAG: phosphoribosylformylglycinamidine synthase subunit PurL [Chloroflexi bacterium]|nr:phosphoribosylformylglycinamidine synthase subunit PurL [Chloroflexota bacterium]